MGLSEASSKFPVEYPVEGYELYAHNKYYTNNFHPNFIYELGYISPIYLKHALIHVKHIQTILLSNLQDCCYAR
jgi:hypothetical protein